MNSALFRIKKEGKYGFIDHTGKIVIEAKYDFAANVIRDNLIYVSANGNYGFIDTNGKVVIEPRFKAALWFSEGLALVQNHEDEWGYIDHQGELKIPFMKYDNQPWDFAEGLACVKTGGKWGYIDAKGDLSIKPSFETTRNFSCAYAVVNPQDGYGFIDRSGHLCTSEYYDECHDFSEGFARVIKNGKSGYCGSDCMLAIGIQYEWGRDFVEGFACVNKKGKVFYIDTNDRGINEKLTAMNADKVEDCMLILEFSEGLAPIKIDNKWGFIDKVGDIAIKPFADFVDNFSDNAAFFRCKDRSGFIDNKGTVIVSLHSQSKTILLPGFYNGICGIKEADDTWAYINKKGDCIWRQDEAF